MPRRARVLALGVLLGLVQGLRAGFLETAPDTGPAPEGAEVDARLKVLLDCDPGVDDVLALWWLASAEQQGFVDLLAITTVAGNAGGATAFRNAAIAAKFHAVYRSKQELVYGRSGQANPSDGFFGADGMSNLSELMLEAALPDRGLEPLLPDFATARPSPEVIVETLNAQPPQSVTILAVGPLTNLALAEDIQPGILARAREVVAMGGGFGFDGPYAGIDGYSARGNVRAMAEFNIWSDAASAAKVMGTAARGTHATDVVLVPLDVTQQLCLTADQNERILTAVAALTPPRFKREHIESEVGPAEENLVVRMLLEMVLRLEEPLVERAQRCLYLHDPSAVGYLLYPHLFHLKRLRVSVGIDGDFQGHTFTDLRPHLQGNTNAFVTHGVEKEDFLMALRRDLALLAVEKAAEMEKL